MAAFHPTTMAYCGAGQQQLPSNRIVDAVREAIAQTRVLAGTVTQLIARSVGAAQGF